MDDQRVAATTAPPLKRRLGRGLTALLGSGGDAPAVEPRVLAEEPPSVQSANESEAANSSDEIAVEMIERNPFQPRTEFEEEALLELAESIRQHGVLQPLLVRIADDGYQLIAGERRWLAAQKAGLETVPCRVLDLPDQEVSEVAIEENLKRKDLNALEKAAAFQEYLKRFDATIEELAKRLSMNRSTVSNILRLLELPEAVKDAVWADKISAGHARALLPLNEDQQSELCKRIQSEGLSVRKTEEAVRGILQPAANEASPVAPGKTAPAVSNHVVSLQNQLREMLGMKVEIRLRNKDAGKVIMHFESNDDFERLFKSLREAA